MMYRSTAEERNARVRFDDDDERVIERAARTYLASIDPATLRADTYREHERAAWCQALAAIGCTWRDITEAESDRLDEIVREQYAEVVDAA